jgi:hypothetical protein
MDLFQGYHLAPFGVGLFFTGLCLDYLVDRFRADFFCSHAFGF